MANVIIWNSLVFSSLIRSFTPPVRSLGPNRLASWLRQHGYTVQVIDFCHLIPTEKLIEMTSKYIDSTTIAIGVSTTFWLDWERRVTRVMQREMSRPTDVFFEPDWVIAAREKLQAKEPSIQWLLGGQGVDEWTSASKDEKMPWRFEWEVFRSFGEDSVLKYLDEKRGKMSLRPSFSIFSAGNSFIDTDYIQPHEVLPIDLARGCQFKCTFCRYPLLGRKKNTYLRDYQCIEDELRYNYDHFGTTHYVFVDDTVNESEEKVVALAEIANRLPFKLQWVGYCRMDLIGSKPHTIELLEQSGLRGPYFGIETFNKDSAKMIRKAWNGTHGKDFLLSLQERWKDKINFYLGLIIGLGQDTEEELREDAKWLNENIHGYWLYNALSITRHANVPFPSVFDTEYEKFGYKFIYDYDDHNWTNGHWTRDSAAKLAMDLNKIRGPYQRLSCWALSRTATVGYTYDEILTPSKLASEFNWTEAEAKIPTMMNTYINNHLK